MDIIVIGVAFVVVDNVVVGIIFVVVNNVAVDDDEVQDIAVTVAGVEEANFVVVGASSFIINVAVRTPTPVETVRQIPPIIISFNKLNFGKAEETAPCLQLNLLAR